MILSSFIFQDMSRLSAKQKTSRKLYTQLMATSRRADTYGQVWRPQQGLRLRRPLHGACSAPLQFSSATSTSCWAPRDQLRPPPPGPAKLLWEDAFDRAGGRDAASGVTPAGGRVFAVGGADIPADFSGIPLIRAYGSETGHLLWQPKVADGQT